MRVKSGGVGGGDGEGGKEREGQRTSHCKSVHAYIIKFFSKFIVFFSEFPSPLKFTLK